MRYSAEQWKRFLAWAVNMKIRLNFDISETLSSPRLPWALIQARKPYNVHEQPINRQHYNAPVVVFDLFLSTRQISDERLEISKNLNVFFCCSWMNMEICVEDFENSVFFIFLHFFYSISFFYSSFFWEEGKRNILKYNRWLYYLGRIFYCYYIFGSICKVLRYIF